LLSRSKRSHGKIIRGCTSKESALEIPSVADYRKLRIYAQTLIKEDNIVKAMLESETLDNERKRFLLADYLILAHLDKPMEFNIMQLRDAVIAAWRRTHNNWIQTTSGPGYTPPRGC